MLLKMASLIAQKYLALLAPFCDRIEIAGSIRRKNSEVHDIEIVCIPKRESTGLFGCELVPVEGFFHIVNNLKRIKGAADGRYCRRGTPEGIDIDLFMVHEENFGLQLAIRTGPASYSHKVLGRGWVKAGMLSNEGMLYNRVGRSIPVKEEKDLYKIINQEYVPPEYRFPVGEFIQREAI